MFFVAILLLWLLHILSPPRQKLYREKWGSAYIVIEVVIVCHFTKAAAAVSVKHTWESAFARHY